MCICVSEVVKKLLGGTRGWEIPGVPQGPGRCRTVVADTTAQRRMDIRGGAVGLAAWGGDPSF